MTTSSPPSVFNLTGAIKLLGAANVVSYSQHLATFSRPWPKEQPIFVPSAERIVECANQNKARTHKWVLGFGSNLSFRSQHGILDANANFKQKPNFYPGVDWFLMAKYKEVGDSQPKAGYYLLDMMPRWNLTSWQQQEDNITALGEDYERTDERIFSQVGLAHQKATGQRLFNNKWHWGRILDSDGYHVCVKLYPDGLGVDYNLPSYDDHVILFVSVARKSRELALIA